MSNYERDYINYTSVPTLKNIATVSVISTFKLFDDMNYYENNSYLQLLYAHDDILVLPDRSKSFVKKENILSDLEVPVCLKAHIARISMHLDVQRLEWLNSFQCNECTHSLHWTNEGTIDKKKTVEQFIINNSSHCLTHIFKLACKNCLEACIPQIWDKFNEGKRKRLRSTNMYKSYDHHLLAYWLHFANGDLSKLLQKIQPHDRKNIYNNNHSIYRNMFTLAMYKGNVMAVKYFWKKLADDEKRSNLMQWIDYILVKGQRFFQLDGSVAYQRSNGFSDVLYFLLSNVTDSTLQKNIICNNSLLILNSLFFYWPWQRFLLPTLLVMWDYLDEEVFINFMSLVFQHIEKGYGSDEILRGIWNIMPMSFKNSVLKFLYSDSGTDIFCHLLVKDVGAIIMILNDINIDERKSFIFSKIKKEKLCQVIYDGKLDLFDTFVKKTLTAEADVHELKQCMAWMYGKNLHRHCSKADFVELLEKFCCWAFNSPEQIYSFKNEIIDNVEIICAILLYKDNSYKDFELANKFLNWYYSSNEDINEFKKHLALYRYDIMDILKYSFSTLTKFVHWCFVSDEDVNAFKLLILKNFQFVTSAIRTRYDFKTTDILISWCCQSKEEVKEYKGKLVLSEVFIEILQRVVGNRFNGDGEIYQSSFPKLTKQLIEFISPLEETVIVQLKEKIRNELYLSNRTNYIPFVCKEELFCMIDNANGNINEKNSAINT